MAKGFDSNSNKKHIPTTENREAEDQLSKASARITLEIAQAIEDGKIAEEKAQSLIVNGQYHELYDLVGLHEREELEDFEKVMETIKRYGLRW
ncbi:MAG: hypothetical protein BRC33_12250 [Cyanobacteria bacterium SW_9_44_58]|nr:MAG: hypothetical protein BRC33_12250 [Cyanobacteria bacterium SW_9_44_58]